MVGQTLLGANMRETRLLALDERGDA